MLVKLNELLREVVHRPCAVPAFNVFGYEDSISVVEAAEEVNAPVILATNLDAIQHMPIDMLGKLLCAIAERTKVPVCVHLDHGKSYEIIARAIQAGYTSVMFDGSQLPLEENIRQTREVVKLAHTFGIPVEAEIGAVGYNDPHLNVKAVYTDPREAQIFAEQTGVDALAVSIGTVHRLQNPSAVIQFDRLEQIQALVSVPLVLHGSTGVADSDMKRLIASRIAKVNIGTALRMAFGNTLREEMANRPDEFDRIKLFKEPMRRVKETAKQKMVLLGLV